MGISSLGLLWTLAWRYLWRNKRRSLIMLVTIVVGVWAMIFMLALTRGMIDGMIEDGLKALPGHIQVHHKNFLDDPNIVNSISEIDDLEKEKLLASGFTDWAQRLKVPAVVSSEWDTKGIELWGVEPEREAVFHSGLIEIIDGEYLNSSNSRGVIIGKTLLKKLRTAKGRRIVIMSQDINNDLADTGVKITGVFRSSSPGLEESRVYIGLAQAQRLLGAKNRVSEISVNTGSYRETDEAAVNLKKIIGDSRDKSKTLPWSEINLYLGKMLPVMDGFVLIWVLIIFLALSFGLVNTLAMAVFERAREIGLMQALGVTPRTIVNQVVVEAFLLVSIGIVAGNLLALLTIAPLRDGLDLTSLSEGMEMMGVGNIIYPILKPKDLVISNCLILVLSILASLIPAWRAARYSPVVALKIQ